MIIQTLNCDFLIEETEISSGDLYVYSNCLLEIQRYFGSSSIEFSTSKEWKYRAIICKQYLADSLIHMVKEIDYRKFPMKNQVMV